MSPITIGFIGLGRVGKALAEKSMRAGNRVLLSNSRGPASLTSYVAELGPLASAGTVAEAAQAEVVFLSVRWADISQALQGLPNWEGRIVVDTTNPILADGTFVDLGERTSSELVAAQLLGARVVKAFNSLFAAWMEDEPVQPAGKRVVFVSGDEAEAKNTAKELIAAMGFAPIDLGGLVEGGRLQQAGKPLAALNLLLTN
ncbi:NADPH-dependent F420 reductase [Hymenobacter sp. GOD-10R]|uniref:NADPH-dependent F420 reductase n=1 Tax=Hymenobacter sp. GOD-10R TaxID=3093922 RepID=UPI002D78CEE3|nr:NADPH-dependent F420 reductase [Hymenobacter sp. GOD-10R]WRQ30678.1 NADPH-dependent F420 reductase [Hymenobacter sp. GOD-10R]